VPHELEYATSFAPTSISTASAMRTWPITLLELSCRSTFEVVYPATESFVALTVRPILAVSPSAVSGGYGLQSQLVPRGTESSSATTDHFRSTWDAAVDEDAAEADTPDPGDAVELAAATQPRAITAPTPQTRRYPARSNIVRR
jgi:hypothetical protein